MPTRYLTPYRSLPQVSRYALRRMATSRGQQEIRQAYDHLANSFRRRQTPSYVQAVQDFRARASRFGQANDTVDEINNRNAVVTGDPAVAENTFQHDVQPVYTRRPTSRGQVSAYRRRARLVNEVINSRLPLRTFVKTTTRFQTAAVDQQGYSYSIALGVNTARQTEGNDDLGDIVRQTAGLAPAGAEPSRNSNKVFVQSFQLENIVRNLSPVLCFLDVYRVICRRDMAEFDDDGVIAQAQDIQSLLERGFEAEDPSAGWDNQRIFKHGVTPFQCPMFTSHFKILSKVRYRLEGGATIQLHMRGKIGKTFDYDKNRNLVYKAGWTQGLVFVWYGAPGSTTAEGVYSQACNLRIVRNLQYTYKHIQGNADNIGNFQQVTLAT